MKALDISLLMVFLKEYHKLYSECEIWESNIEELKIRCESFEEDLLKLYSSKDIVDRYSFLSKLSKNLLAIPHTSSEVERTFSQLKLIKTSSRSCLTTTNLEALLIINTTDMKYIDKKKVVNKDTKTKASKKSRYQSKQRNE